MAPTKLRVIGCSLWSAKFKQRCNKERESSENWWQQLKVTAFNTLQHTGRPAGASHVTDSEWMCALYDPPCDDICRHCQWHPDPTHQSHSTHSSVILAVDSSCSLHCKQPKQTRSSATAEKRRFSCPHGGGLGPPPQPSSPWLHLCIWSNPKPATKRTLRWIGHSRSFKVILIGAGRNPERCVVVMCN